MKIFEEENYTAFINLGTKSYYNSESYLSTHMQAANCVPDLIIKPLVAIVGEDI